MLKPKDWVPPTQEELQKKYRSQLAKLKTHLVKGCAMAFHSNNDETGYVSEVVEKPYVAITYWKSNCGTEEYYAFDNRPAVTDDIREVTCGYCKTKLTNELWFKDWKDLTEQELELLKVLRLRRDERKVREEAELG